MDRTESGLWVPSSFNINRMRARTKTVTLPTGERAKVTWDDSGTTRHTETDERLDALVRPRTITLKVRRAT